MEIIGENGVLTLERTELGAAGTPAEKDVRVNVAVSVGGFAAENHSWIDGQSLIEFLSGLRLLESRRRGAATLVAMSPEDLRLEFFATDSVGHMAVRGQVRRVAFKGYELCLRFTFDFEPDQLPRIVREFERLGRV